MFRQDSSTDRRQFLRLVGAGTAGVLVAGCVGGSTNGADGGSSDTLVYTSSTEIPSADPAAISGHADQSVNYNAYEPLVTVNEDLEITERLATDWIGEDDGQRWTLQLREGVEFHDGGTFTAEDVVYTVERAKAVGTGTSSLWTEVIETVEAVDDHEVEFTLTEPFGPFIATLTTCFIVDKETLENAEGEYGTDYLEQHSAGTGPYMIEERKVDDNTVFKQFDGYWQGWDDDSIERYRMEIVQEESTNRQMMITGNAHVTDQYLSPEAYDEIAAADGVSVYEDAQPSLYHIMMNTRKPPFDDVDVRRAFNLVFDAEEAVDNIWGGGRVANGPVPDGIPGKNDDVEPYDYDPDAARDAIDDSNYTVEEINELEITIAHPAGFEDQRRNSLLLQNRLTDIDIEIGVSAEQWSSVTDRVSDPDTAPSMLSSTATATVPTPDAHTYQMYHPSQLGTYLSAAWYSTDELTGVLEDARREPDEQARLELYGRAQELIADGYPSVFVCYVPFRVGLNEQVGGFKDLKLMGASHQVYNYHWK